MTYENAGLQCCVFERPKSFPVTYRKRTNAAEYLRNKQHAHQTEGSNHRFTCLSLFDFDRVVLLVKHGRHRIHCRAYFRKFLRARYPQFRCFFSQLLQPFGLLRYSRILLRPQKTILGFAGYESNRRFEVFTACKQSTR